VPLSFNLENLQSPSLTAPTDNVKTLGAENSKQNLTQKYYALIQHTGLSSPL
jgi:hypothetical protein